MDSIEQLADATLHLLGDRDGRKRMGREAACLANSVFGPDAIRTSYEQIVNANRNYSGTAVVG